MKKDFYNILVTFLLATMSPLFASETPDFHLEDISSIKVEKNLYSIQAAEQELLRIKYFPHNDVSVNQFMRGKRKVSEVLRNLIAQGFRPNQEILHIGIAPNKMNGGWVVIENNRLYVAIDAAKSTIEYKLLYFFHNPDSRGELEFFIHNKANINQFKRGKRKVAEVYRQITESGFQLKRGRIRIGIAPQRMNGGMVVSENGNLYVTYDATKSAIQAKFLPFFEHRSENKRFRFFTHNNANLSQFKIGKQKVRQVIRKLKDNGFRLNERYLRIGIAPKKMNGGMVVIQDGELFIAYEATLRAIERNLLKFFHYDN